LYLVCRTSSEHLIHLKKPILSCKIGFFVRAICIFKYPLNLILIVLKKICQIFTI
jgi:hypothetical protein